MKVVQISSVHNAFDTRIFHKISKSLVNAGFSVDLIIQHSRDEKKEGINIIALPIAVKKIDRLLKVIPSLFLKCITYKKETVFHFHDPELIPLGLFLKLVGYKVIYDVHEDVPKDILTKEWLHPNLRKLICKIVGCIEEYSVSKFDFTIVVTPHIKTRLNSIRTKLVQNFPIIEVEEFPTSNKSSEKYLFYVGDITKIRGVMEMVRSMEIINKVRVDPIRLKLAGKFSPNKLQKELESLKGWENIDFVGWVKRKEMKNIARNAIAGFVIFHPVPNHLDAQPNKLFEYMLEGLPVIASDFPLWKEFIDKNQCGILIDPLEPRKIADAVCYLLDHPEISRIMGENGRKAVNEKYNWGKEKDKLLTVYEYITKPSGEIE